MFNAQYREYSEQYLRHYYIHDDGDGRGPYQLQALKTVSAERLEELKRDGRIVKGKGRYLRFKDYLRDKKGVLVNDIWTDIEPVNPVAKEKLGYPTQKPEALLERMIEASSNRGETVLYPFCGCGTAVAAAQKLNRQWIGIDITHLAVNLIRHRLRDAYGPSIEETYEVIGEPTSVPDAEALAASDPYQFQWWALGKVGARLAEHKKGADKGIDGRLFFHDEAAGGKTKQVIISVKAGHTGRHHVHELRGVIEREGAAIGALISMEAPTRPMREEAASAGFYHSDAWNRDHPRLQLLTIKDLLEGKTTLEYPPGENRTFKKAPRVQDSDETGELPFDSN